MGTVPAARDAGHNPAPLQASVDSVLRENPQERVLSLSLEPEKHSGLMLLVSAPSQVRKFEKTSLHYTELANGHITQQPANSTNKVMGFILELHAKWFLGVPGEVLGALIALLVLISLLSGLVVYWPYMKRVAFGLLRVGRSARLRQLDLHNFIGAVVLGWASLVSLTGILLGLGSVATALWSYNALSHHAPLLNSQVPDLRRPPVTVDAALAAAEAGSPPGWRVKTLVFPGTEFSTEGHYTIILGGPRGLEARLFRVALVDASDGHLVTVQAMPFYMKAIILSQPLHFGNYGGLPLKLLWEACTLLTLFITANGAWLWWERRRKNREPVRAVV